MKDIRNLINNYITLNKSKRIDLKVILLSFIITLIIMSIPILMVVKSSMMIFSNKFLFGFIILLLILLFIFIFEYIYYNCYKSIIDELKEYNIIKYVFIETLISSIVPLILVILILIFGKWW